MFRMSYQEALDIQWKQIAFYRSVIGRRGVKMLRAATKPCPPGIHPLEDISVIEINKLVPRGGAFENIRDLGRV